MDEGCDDVGADEGDELLGVEDVGLAVQGYNNASLTFILPSRFINFTACNCISFSDI